MTSPSENPNGKKFFNLQLKTWWIRRSRAGFNEREAPGKVLTARPPYRLVQLRSVSNALVASLQKHRSKTSKLIRFGSSLNFRHFGATICSNRKLYHKKTIFFAAVTPHDNIFSHTLSDHLHCTNRPFTCVFRNDMSTLSRRSKRTPFRNNVLNETSRLKFCDRSCTIVTTLNCSVI